MNYSIIVPAYNSELFLGRCLDSLVKQTYNSLEIIVIDDGSVDNTLMIAREYERKNKNVKVFHQDNKGLVAARHTGIKKASGKYCMMVDADDWIELDTLNKIDCCVNKFRDVDIVKFRFEFEPSGKKSTPYTQVGRVLDSDDVDRLRKDLLLTSRYNNLCNQIVKRDLYERVNYDAIKSINYGEDAIVNIDLFEMAKKIVLINDSFYHYYKNPNSITNKTSIDSLSKNISDNIELNKRRMLYLEDNVVNGVDANVLKNRALMFACGQIKNLDKNELDCKKIKDCIEASGLRSFLNGIRVERNGFIDTAIGKCIVNDKLHLIKYLKPYIIVRNRIKSIYRGYHAR